MFSIFGGYVMGFEKWFHRLLLCAMDGEIVGHPLGSCLERDVLRDPKVKRVMQDSYNRIILGEGSNLCKQQGCSARAHYCETHGGKA